MAELNSFLPYNEPDIATILVQSSFLLILNLVNTLFDRLIFCGLVAQVFIGVAWGKPGAQWLEESFQATVVQLGYLGLILLVYEGGLETNFQSLKANIVLSVAVAITGIGAPIALSFVLESLSTATPIQCFAAGAALCSTSLGTTFTILSTSGLSATRLGTVLTSAAMMDDVVGLIMVQVISNLGNSEATFSAITVVRPIAVSIGFVTITLVVCRFLAKPVTLWFNRKRSSQSAGLMESALEWSHTPFIIHTALLLGFVAASSYAGTSNLFAAYLAGASISFWDSDIPHSISVSERNTASTHSGSITGATEESETRHTIPEPQHNVQIAVLKHTTGSAVYEYYYSMAVKRILKPFFFASVGFAVPITDMFSGPIVWRGIVFTILMLFGKLVTGLWLIRLSITIPNTDNVRRLAGNIPTCCSKWLGGHLRRSQKPKSQAQNIELRKSPPNFPSIAIPQNDMGASTASATETEPQTGSAIQTPKKIDKPLSLYPAAMLGTAMTARGEIGFLIASLAETSGLFRSSSTSSGSSEIYLVVVWAILLCTIIGPLSVGTLVKRVNRLQAERAFNPSKPDPLGIWGIT